MHFDVFLPALRNASASLAPIVVAGLWQGLAIAAALALALRIAPRLTAAHRFNLWAAGFAALVSLPFLPLFTHMAASTAVSAAPASASPAPAAWFQLSLNWSLALAVLWALASLLRLIDLAAHSLHLRRLWRTATPIPGTDPRLAGLPALDSRATQLCTTAELDRPSVIGFFAPRILIPGWLLSRLTPGELRQIVLHESEHLRRRDDWTNLLQKLCLVLFPLNPALWFIERRLCSEREMACDEGVVLVTRAPRAYAACLASLAERGLQRQSEALSLGAWQQRSELARRVHSLLLRRRALNPVATRALLGILGCGLIAGSVELARAPQLVAFVAAQPAIAAAPKAIANTLPAHASAPASELADAHPLPIRSLRSTHPLRTAIHRTPARVHASATLLAALDTNLDTKNDLHAASSAEMIPTRAFGTPQLQAANAPATSSRAAAGSSPAPVPTPLQEWIVFTAWQQVQTESLRTDSAATRRSGASTRASAERSDKLLDTGPQRRFTTHFMVTRVFLRVIPASSAPANAAVLPMRGGWLVFQL